VSIQNDASPTVSVALCTHNGERFIEAQLRSILEQSYRPLEIVLSDDDSTDATVDIARATVDSWETEHPDIAVKMRVLRNRPALRVAKNFEQAILECSGDLIALCDQDDVWHPDRVETIVDIFSSRPDVLLVHTDARLVGAEGAPLGGLLLDTLRVSRWERDSINSGHASRVLIRRNVVTGATAVVRRDTAHRAMPVPEGWIHDEWLAAFAAAHGALVLDERVLVDYRQHDNNQIGAASLNTAGKFSRLRAPRAERNRRLLVRAASLTERLSAPTAGDAVAEEVVTMAAGKYAHERFRSDLPVSRFARILPVLRRAASGSYAKFGLGAQDVLRDIVQPAR
jgi:glycosyltransferase involved in cell wall biosynthesis